MRRYFGLKCISLQRYAKMSKKLAIYILLLLFPGGFAATAQSDWRTPQAISIQNGPSAENLQAEVEFFCDSLRQGRGRGSAGHADAAIYIAQRLRDAGCYSLGGSYSHSFTVSTDGTPGHNIMGVLKCAKWNSGRYIIVGAHYDGLGMINGILYPGADSNASGVAAMLEIAHSFKRQLGSGYSYSGNILFVAFDSYVDGREGSQALWDSIMRGELHDPNTGNRIRPADIIMMVDLDQMGSTLAPVNPNRKDFVIALGEKSLLKPGSKTLLDRCNSFYDINLDIQRSYYGSDNFTDVFYSKLGDRRVFIRAGIPTMYFTSGITETTNKRSDTAAGLNYEVLQRRTTLIFRFLEKSF